MPSHRHRLRPPHYYAPLRSTTTTITTSTGNSAHSGLIVELLVNVTRPSAETCTYTRLSIIIPTAEEVGLRSQNPEDNSATSHVSEPAPR